MTDELERLKTAFRKAPKIEPEPGRRNFAIERAMMAFDENNSPAVQGSILAERLRDTATAAYETLIGRRSMRMTPALAGGASLGVLALAMMSASYVQTNLRDPLTGVAPRPAGPAQNVVPLKKAPKPQDAGRAKTESDVASKKLRDQVAQIRASEDAAPKRPTSVPSVPPAGAVASHPAPHPAPMARGVVGAQHRFGSPAVSMAEREMRRPDPGTTSHYEAQGRDKFDTVTPNPVKVTSEEPVSTFSIDVDTASYAFMRAALNNNTLPQKDAVRVEELINYFPYDYARPADKAAPFKANVSVLPSPWNADRKLVHVGIAGFDLKKDEKPRSNLVFLLDTSGSMNAPDKLPLLVNSMKLLLTSLEPDDTVAIVTYAGSAGTVLEPTAVKDKAKIVQALNSLNSRGSTAGAEGIRQAYELAQQNFEKGGVNRVILATDGDFNVGITDKDQLKSFVERKRKTGVSLSVLGFGTGNYNDALMQALAQNGNGNAAYIDTLNEARKVLVEQAGSTLFTIARDVKLQLEFNPATVSEYRLIGYETRLLKREDFKNDKVDAGDIGAGHTVTAVYEITPADSKGGLIDPLRYGAGQGQQAVPGKGDEYGFMKIRYKLPDEQVSKLITVPIKPSNEYKTMEAAPVDVRFAASVAAFGQILRGGRYTGSYGYDDVIALAQGAKGDDPFGYRAEFVNLARLAKSAAAMETLRRR